MIDSTERKPSWAAGLPDRTADGDTIVYGAEPPGPRIDSAFIWRGSTDTDAPSLVVLFDNDEARSLDLTPLFDHPAFAPLVAYEEVVRLTVLPFGHGIEWASGADMSANYAYRQGRPLAMARRAAVRAA